MYYCIYLLYLYLLCVLLCSIETIIVSLCANKDIIIIIIIIILMQVTFHKLRNVLFFLTIYQMSGF